MNKLYFLVKIGFPFLLERYELVEKICYNYISKEKRFNKLYHWTLASSLSKNKKYQEAAQEYGYTCKKSPGDPMWPYLKIKNL